MNDATTALSDELRKLAKGHDREADLIEKAKAFDDAAVGFYSEPQTVSVGKFMSCWAKARRAYSEVTGEPLMGSKF